jgi:iron complex transport system substrate-binding protein
MIALAGGDDLNGRSSADSVRLSWEDVVNASPDIVIVAPCGYGLDQASEAARQIPAVPGARIFAVDANAYFARPGPRVAEGIELLAHIFHPDRFAWPHETIPFIELGDKGT